ncbi:MAG: HlyD family type I secretion periplasmic adaptor subunit, partial [Geminicoccales bacterium]
MAETVGGRSAAPARAAPRPKREDAEFVFGPAATELIGPRGFAHLLLAAVGAFFVLFFAWASWATLDEVTRGDGKVIPSSHVQVVQNLEGGIVADLLVREGQIVEAGEILLRVENVRAAGELRESRKRYLALLGAVTRLRAEVEEKGLAFPPEVLAEASQVVENERALFYARQEALQSELEILGSQAEQREQELAELQSQLVQLERSHALAAQELEITQRLANQRLVAKVELLRLQREVSDLVGQIETTRLAVPRVRSALGEAHRRVEDKVLSFRAEAQRELTAVQAEATVLLETINTSADRVRRTDVRSPVRGTIKRLLITTVGGVIQPGEDLVEI